MTVVVVVAATGPSRVETPASSLVGVGGAGRVGVVAGNGELSTKGFLSF